LGWHSLVSKALYEAGGAVCQQPVFHQKRYVFGGEGFQMSTAELESTVKWPYVTDIRETPTHIFLMTGTLDAFIIPKRCFISSVQEIELRQLAKAHVPPPN